MRKWASKKKRNKNKTTQSIVKEKSSRTEGKKISQFDCSEGNIDDGCTVNGFEQRCWCSDTAVNTIVKMINESKVEQRSD